MSLDFGAKPSSRRGWAHTTFHPAKALQKLHTGLLRNTHNVVRYCSNSPENEEFFRSFLKEKLAVYNGI